MSDITEGTPEHVHHHTAACSLDCMLDGSSLSAIPLRAVPENHPDLHLPERVLQGTESNSSLRFARLDDPSTKLQKTGLQPFMQKPEGH